MHRGGMAKWANKGWRVLVLPAASDGRKGKAGAVLVRMAMGSSKMSWRIGARVCKGIGVSGTCAHGKRRPRRKKPLGKEPSGGVKGCISISLKKMIPTHDH